MCTEVMRAVRFFLSEWHLSTGQRLGRSSDGKDRKCSTEVLKGLKSRRFFASPLSTTSVSRSKKLSQEKTMPVARINGIHETLELLQKKVGDNKKGWEPGHSKPTSPRKNFISFNLYIGDYVIVHIDNLQHRNPNSGWIEPMHTIESKLGLVFIAEDLHRLLSLTVLAQCLKLYPV